MLAGTAVGGDGLPRCSLIEVGEERVGKGDGVGLDLGFGGGRDEGADVGDDSGAAGVEEVLNAGEIRIEGEGASGLRRQRRDGQQVGERIGEAGCAGAGGGERGEGIGVGSDHGAVAIIAALQEDAHERLVVGGAIALRHGGHGVEPENDGAGVHAGHGGERSGAEELAARELLFVFQAGAHWGRLLTDSRRWSGFRTGHKTRVRPW